MNSSAKMFEMKICLKLKKKKNKNQIFFNSVVFVEFLSA